MSKSKRNQNKKRKRQKLLQHKPPLLLHLKQMGQNWWQDKRSVILFMMAFGGLLILFYGFLYSSLYREFLSPIIVYSNAYLANELLHLFQYATSVNGATISGHEGISVSVQKGCDAVEPIFLFAAVLVAFPSQWSKKIIGLILGSLVLLGLNLFRIAGLYLTNLHYPAWFDFAHIQIGQFVFIIFSVACCAFWLRWQAN